MKTPEITEAEALRGEKEIAVETRTGEQVKLLVKALPWRAAIIISHLSIQDPGRAVVEAIEHCLDKEHRDEAFLDSIPPAHLVQIAQVSLQLSNGVTEIKKLASVKQ